ncbi:peptidoglycan editing factor PgeF [Paenibacillus sp. sptzw28]|uniref:peptidoglycan editing factor PgeF n=1 Tax=Paenibacillus sp. sptzw28 TaxID=715179 RepID=UPI001C6F41AE|nr:peptidoglycan editing factor PgeF [Paenibacillus sp. sptzw28]QYR20075.1 peptidoglycan editing factor PgeF [Paenibacillus sp. sptzw28]
MEPFERMETAKGPSLFLLPRWMEGYGGLSAGFTSRLGGTSAEPWTSLNCGLHVGDDAGNVVANRKLLAEALAWPFDAWTCAEQVHGTRVYRVTAADRGKGRESRESAIAEADALMTNEKDVLLTSFYADCVPLYFFDPVCGVVALAHAGWKGTVMEIARLTAEAMKEQYNCSMRNIRAAIGPSIGLCCYEVDGIVLERARPLQAQLERTLRGDGVPVESVIKPTANGKARINLKELNRQIMIKAGILPINIEMSEWCTGCSTELFFSHRAEGGATGRMVSWIGIGRGGAHA